MLLSPKEQIIKYPMFRFGSISFNSSADLNESFSEFVSTIFPLSSSAGGIVYWGLFWERSKTSSRLKIITNHKTGKKYGIHCGEFLLNEPESTCHITTASEIKNLLFKMFEFFSWPL